VRDGALLAAFAGLLFFAAVQLSGRRSSSSAARSPSSFLQRASRDAENRDARRERRAGGQGAAAAVAWVGMVLASVALLGHLAAPAADPLWIALLAVAFASIPAAALIGKST
jgi:hypothetical protein